MITKERRSVLANKRKRFIRKSFDNQLEEVLTKKLYREEVKNLLLDTLYKIETSYQDYSKVKKNVLPKEVYIDNIINAIKDECNSIKFVAPDNKEMAGRTFVVDKEKKTIKCYPIARKLLYSISKIQKSEDIVKTESELVNRTLTNTLNVGNNINTTEPLRDFNGFSWNVSVLEIENLYYNLIYQDLIILVGNEFLEEWINENKAMIEYMELFKEELEKRWGKKVAKNVVELLEKISVLLEFSIDAQFKEQVKAREIVVKKQLEKMSDKAKYLEDISKKKKMVEKEIKDIDKTVNDKELLKQKYT